MTELRRAVDQLRQSLDAIEPVLNEEGREGDLEEFKATLDRVRVNVQAISSVINPTKYPETVTRFRLRRTAEICQRVLSGISDHTITRQTPGFDRFRSVVEQTLEEFDRLKKKS